jgi:hypothetical protein
VSATATSIPTSPVLTEITAGLGLSLTQAARRFPPHRRGRPVCSSTVWRWMHDGIRLNDGTLVRLKAARVSGRWLTSELALARFLASQQEDGSQATMAPAARTPNRRHKAAERAGKELESLGV